MPDSFCSIKIEFYLFFPAGGIGKYTHELVTALDKYDDLEIEVACLPNFQWRDSEAYRAWPYLFGISHEFPVVRKFRFLLGQFINPRRMLRRTTERRADILHVCNINHLSYPTWKYLLDSWGGRVVCTAHDVRRRSAIVNKQWETAQLKAFYRRCDAIFVHGDAQRDELADFANVEPTRIHIVPHGPNEYPSAENEESTKKRHTLGIADDVQVALFFGFIRPDKNLDGFLRAVSLADDPRLHVVIVGQAAAREDRYAEQCRELVNRLDLADRVTFETRYIGDDELPLWFSICDWVVSTYAESFTSMSGVVNVAAYYEKPILATPGASLRELLEKIDLGVVCPGFSDTDIASGIREITERIRRGTRFRFDLYRDRYSWAENAAITRNVYLDLCGCSRAQ